MKPQGGWAPETGTDSSLNVYSAYNFLVATQALHSHSGFLNPCYYYREPNQI